MPHRILITGSRKWNNRSLLEDTLRSQWESWGCPSSAVLVSGHCPTGADRLCETFWTQQGLPVETHPANWNQHGRAAGPIRNSEMVELGADRCIAFVTEESRGTWNCIKLAQKAGIPVTIIKDE